MVSWAVWPGSIRVAHVIGIIQANTYNRNMYWLSIGLMFATMDVRLGLPGVGWMTLVLMIVAGFCGSERVGTEQASRTALTPPKSGFQAYH